MDSFQNLWLFNLNTLYVNRNHFFGSMALLALLTTLLALLNGSADSAHDSAGSAQWLCWLCSRLCWLCSMALLTTLLTNNNLLTHRIHQTSTALASNSTWQYLFPILTNRLLILSTTNSSNNRLTINQTPALQTNFIRSKDNNNVSSTFLNEFWPTESYLPVGAMNAFPMALSSPNGTKFRSIASSQLQNGMANSGPDSISQKQVIKLINLGDS